MPAVIADGDRLRGFAAAALGALGMPRPDAATAAEVLVRTDLRGIRSHGVRHLPGYARQIRAGGIVAAAERRTVVDTAATATLDAGAGLGHVAAHAATELAIAKARHAGIAIVLVRNSNHCGALGHYALMCAEAGLIGLAVSNCPPVMTVPGSRSRAIGNGPTAYGVPHAGGVPIVFDVALSKVAGGRIQMARERGVAVPAGWIVDAEGRATTDPDDFARGGALLPVGEHKGYGLALFGEILAGALSGAAMISQIGTNRTPEKPTDTGHAVIAVDPIAVMPDGGFAARVAELGRLVKSSPRAGRVDEILLPGELEHREEVRARAQGIELDDVIWRQLLGLAGELGLGAELEGARRA
jgi:LDH2 family malate/lactate/ureidoglycolate dehydrogenase